MYQDDIKVAWGNINILQNHLFLAEIGFEPPTSGLWVLHDSSAPLC